MIDLEKKTLSTRVVLSKGQKRHPFHVLRLILFRFKFRFLNSFSVACTGHLHVNESDLLFAPASLDLSEVS